MPAAGTVLFVCHANVCRSAMAAAICTDLAARAGVDVTVTSAGVRAYDGQPISDGAATELARRGVPSVPHASHHIDAGDALAADLVITATRSQRDQIGSIAPIAWARTFVIAELGDLIAGAVPGPETQTLAAVARLAHERRRLTPNKKFSDLADPMGRGPEEYEVCADAIVGVLVPLVALLAG
jgi:protein-tyrosine phosphatase